MNFLPYASVSTSIEGRRSSWAGARKWSACGGKRYKPDTLAVRYKGKNINDVLEMTVSQAIEFFRSHPFIYPA